MTAPLDEKGLLPCPFCGSEPSVTAYETESLWSHDQVTYTKVECPECEISFHSEPGYEVEAPDAWNRRAYFAASPSPSEMEVVEGLLSDGQPLVTLSQAQSALAAKDAEAKKWWLKCCETQQDLNAAEAQVLRLTEENKALRKERTSLIETKREQIERMQRRLDLHEAAIAFVRRWAVEKEENGTSAEERLSAIAHHPALKENAL